MKRAALRPVTTAGALTLLAVWTVGIAGPARAEGPAAIDGDAVADAVGDANLAADARAAGAAADDGVAPVPWVPVAGALTAVGSLAAGGALLAHDRSPDLQRVGVYVILAGFAAAPWVAHAGRWRRALVFGLASVAASLGTLAAMRLQDPFDPGIANHDRLAFGALLTTSFFAAGVGVADGFLMPPAPRASR